MLQLSSRVCSWKNRGDSNKTLATSWSNGGPRPNTALHLTAYSLRFAALRSGFRQQVSLGVRPQA
jgi:hypothetical protein